MQLIWCTVFFLWFFEELRCQKSPSPRGESNTTASEIDITKGYVVWNPSCRIPHFDPYDNSIKEYIQSAGKPKICSHLDSLTKVQFNSSTQRYTLEVNSNVAPKYWSTISSIRCCFAEIRGNQANQASINDNKYNLSKAVCFKNQVELPANAENIFVYCTSRNRKIFRTVYFIAVDKAKDKKLKPVPSKSGPNKKKYNILLFGLSSVSRLNFVRSLPKTKKFFEEQGWLPLEGYTKVGEDTFSNLVAILTGRTVDQLTKVCQLHKKHKLDDCPFIWKNFSKNGYLTSFTEDSTETRTFNQEKYKFLSSPTDFYSQPLLSAAENLLRKKNDSEANDYCLGQRPKIEYLFQFNTEFLQRFHNRPYFNLFWMNNNDDAMDDRIRIFLEEIEPYLNSTVAIFFSDQGRPSGDIRQTFLGWLEEQMPFVYFHLPPLLKAAHSNWYQNLLGNKNKLISPFDLHVTLHKLVHGRVNSPIPGCPKCASLFTSVPYDRECSKAAIPPAGCTCWTSNNSNSVSNPPATAPAYEAISSINKFLQKKVDKLKSGYRCATLSLSKVTEVRNENVNGTSKKIIAFVTQPKKAVFEVTLPLDIVKVGNVEEIRRIDKGSDQSSCVKSDIILKTFCHCTKM